MFFNGKIGYWLSYEIDYVYRFDKKKKNWVSVFLMMKIMKKMMEGEGTR